MRTRETSVLLVVVMLLVGSGSLIAAAQSATPETQVDYSSLDGEISADGSSTVWPITDEAALRFGELAEGVEITVGFSGTGAGFRKFCNGEIDLQSASRPIEPDEEAACLEGGVDYFVFEVAYDGITVVVSETNTYVSCLTVAQLQSLWRPDDAAQAWRDLDPSWPDETIELFGPGPDSGTFDYFTAAINGEEGVSRTDYTPSENDLDLVEGVAQDNDGLAYFGYAYYEHEQGRLNAVAIDSGAGCVLPTPDSIADGSYAPLSRPLFLYVRASSLQRPEVAAFMRYYLTNAAELAVDAGYVPVPVETDLEDLERLELALKGQIAPDGPPREQPDAQATATS